MQHQWKKLIFQGPAGCFFLCCGKESFHLSGSIQTEILQRIMPSLSKTLCACFLKKPAQKQTEGTGSMFSNALWILEKHDSFWNYNSTVKCFGVESRCWLITEGVRTSITDSFLLEQQDKKPEKICPQLLNSAVLQPGLKTSSHGSAELSELLLSLHHTVSFSHWNTKWIFSQFSSWKGSLQSAWPVWTWMNPAPRRIFLCSGRWCFLETTESACLFMLTFNP